MSPVSLSQRPHDQVTGEVAKLAPSTAFVRLYRPCRRPVCSTRFRKNYKQWFAQAPSIKIVRKSAQISDILGVQPLKASKTKPIATPRPVSSSPFKIQTPLCPRTIHRDFKIIVTKRDMLGVQLLKNNEKQEASETSTGFYEPI
ncbi:hypothetical protein PGTUg99_036926 [Puccinia graminis f. sp. tritici]|uniref:Uncharacterized protein n=1 Tax=Puccinia graminis f. sp. tritici TaxID=56615 RepID=A0A5B0SN10_PUCGR|nr:hypothetical protein PGTUg99_036926 [Puccinia graminis f. sp. tritici]